MNVGCCNERLLLFLIIVPLSLYPPGRKNFRCAESYPRGVGSTIMDGNRTTGRTRSRSFRGKYPQIEKSSQAIDMPRDRLPKI